MITTPKGYELTKEQLIKFETALNTLDSQATINPEHHDEFIAIWRDALSSQIEEFKEDIAKYEADHACTSGM